jgi:hypothetical protein
MSSVKATQLALEHARDSIVSPKETAPFENQKKCMTYRVFFHESKTGVRNDMGGAQKGVKMLLAEFARGMGCPEKDIGLGRPSWHG